MTLGAPLDVILHRPDQPTDPTNRHPSKIAGHILTARQIQAGLSGATPPPPMGYGGRPEETMSEGAGSERSVPDFLKPTDSYIPPTSGFFFGQVIETPSILAFIPNRDAGHYLLQRYFVAVHPIARCVHRPSFERQYAQFWDDFDQGVEPRPSIQAVVFAAWFSATVSMDEDRIGREFGVNKVNMVERMKVGTETALSKANFLRTTNIETMQAFIMYMVSRTLCFGALCFGARPLKLVCVEAHTQADSPL